MAAASAMSFGVAGTNTYTGGSLLGYNRVDLTSGSRFMVGSQIWEIDYVYVYDTAILPSDISTACHAMS